MKFRDSLALVLATVSAFLVLSTDATGVIDTEPWDLAVAIDNKIDFINRNGTQIRSYTVAEADGLIKTFAYDSANRTLYMDYGNGIVSAYISEFTKEVLHPQLLLGYADAGVIPSMGFDPVTKTLFWINFYDAALMKMEVSEGTPTSPTILHDLRKLEPRNIAIDICDRFIYWTTYNYTTSIGSIERSRLDGSDRRVVSANDNYRVYALAVDYHGRKLYFAGSLGLYYYEIDEINSARTDRMAVSIYPTRVFFHLAVDDTALYWTDSSIWKLDKKGTTKKAIQLYNPTYLYDIMGSIITRDAGDIDCKAVFERKGKRSEIRPATPTPCPTTSPPPTTTATATATTEKLIAAAEASSNQTAEIPAKIDEFLSLLTGVKESFVTAEQLSKATVEAVVELSKRVDALSNQNQLLVTRIGILEDARKVQADEISRLVATTSEPDDR